MRCAVIYEGKKLVYHGNAGENSNGYLLSSKLGGEVKACIQHY